MIKKKTTKLLIALSTVLGVPIIILSGIAIAAKQKNPETKNTEGYHSNYDLSTALNASKVEAFIVKRAGDYAFDSYPDKLNLETKKVNEEIDVDEFFKAEAKKNNGLSPDLIIKYGSVTFNNEYTNVIYPSDFIDFVYWFIENISYGPEINVLDTFSVVRGIDSKAGAITLGGFENKKLETNHIKFYPDAFFGSLPIYNQFTGANRFQDKLLSPYGKDATTKDILNVLNNVLPLYENAIKLELEELFAEPKSKPSENVEKKEENKTASASEPSQAAKETKAKKPKVKKVKTSSGTEFTKSDIVSKKLHQVEFYPHLYKTKEKLNAKGEVESYYQLYHTSYNEIFKDLKEVYPYHFKRATSAVLKRQDDGTFSIVEEEHDYLPISERIPLLELLNLKGKPFKGLGFSWLRYVATHEYAHHQTLNFSSELSNQYTTLGPWSLVSGNSKAAMYDINKINLYLKARAPELEARKAVFDGSANPNENNVFTKFLINGVEETNKQIFGTDDEDRFFFDFLKDDYRGMGATYFEAFLKDIMKWINKKEKAPFLLAFNSGYYKFISEHKFKTFDAAVDLIIRSQHSALVPHITFDFVRWAKEVAIPNGTITYVTLEELPRAYLKIERAKEKFKNKPYLVYLLNAWDNNSGTISGGYDGVAQILSDKGFVPYQDKEKIDRSEGEHVIVKNYSINGFESNAPTGNTSYLGQVLNSMKEKSKYYIDELSGIFSDYTWNFAETIGRDIIQISYLPDRKPLMPGFKHVSEANSGLEYFISKEHLQKYNFRNDIFDLSKHRFDNYNSLFTLETGIGLKNSKLNSYLAISIDELLKAERSTISEEVKESLKLMMKNVSGWNYLFSHIDFTPTNIKKIGGDNSLSNGYFKDRFIRREVNWNIYNDDGSQVPYQGPLKDINGKKIKGVADALWTYLLKSQDIGENTISKIWRNKKRDALFLYGFVKIQESQEIAKLAFQNLKTKEIKYQALNLDQDRLFYYTNVKEGSKRTLRDEGFTSWTTNYFSSGLYDDAFLTKGKYRLFFTDKNNQELDYLKLKDNHLLTENGKLKEASSSFISKNENGEIILEIKDQFVV